MSNEDISELLAVTYASYRIECDSKKGKPVTPEIFHEYYKGHIQDFRHLMNVDIDERKLNG